VLDLDPVPAADVAGSVLVVVGGDPVHLDLCPISGDFPLPVTGSTAGCDVIEAPFATSSVNGLGT
jgi:hypothetical protein